MRSHRSLSIDASNGRIRTRRALAALLAGGLIAAACGSDDEAEPPAEPAAEEEVAEEEAAEEEVAEDEPAEEVVPPSGDPIKIMATGTIESPVFSVPNTPVGAQIAVDEINAAGGVNGRPLELLVCNDELDPNKAAGCIQQAIDEGVVSLVSGLSVFEALVFPQLNEAGIPWIGSATSTDFSTPILFPLAADGATAFSAVGFAAVDRGGCETPAVFISSQGSDANADAVSAGVEAAGGTVSSVHQGQGPDFAPLVESALADGADCITSVVSPPENAGLITAIAGRVPVISLDGPLPEQLVADLGDAVDGTLIAGGYRLAAAGDANVLELAAKSAELFPEAYIDNFWVHGYVGVNIIAEVLEGSDDTSAAAVLAGLPSITDFDTGFGPIIDFSTPNTAPGYERIFNTDMLLWEANGGVITLVEGVDYDMQSALDILGAG
ncbi:MAG: ABC transporter substrate-binding protein [Ilumatobacter sp.]